jgi:hypothetical protein
MSILKLSLNCAWENLQDYSLHAAKGLQLLNVCTTSTHNVRKKLNTYDETTKH